MNLCEGLPAFWTINGIPTRSGKLAATVNGFGPVDSVFTVFDG